MTKAELIKENERYKKHLKEIYERATAPVPLQGNKDEEKSYKKGGMEVVIAGRLGFVIGSASCALDPNWMIHTLEETEAIIASL